MNAPATAQETPQMTTETTSSFIRTESAPAEVPRSLKHLGTIAGIVAITANTGNRGIEINAQSDSNGKAYKMAIWPPPAWTENVFITGAELAKLPRPEGVTEKGNPKQSPYERFGRTISATDGTAELQRLLKATGREPDPNYTDFDSLVEHLATALYGAPVAFTTGPDGEPDPTYGFRIKVRGSFAPDRYDKLKQVAADGTSK